MTRLSQTGYPVIFGEAMGTHDPFESNGLRLIFDPFSLNAQPPPPSAAAVDPGSQISILGQVSKPSSKRTVRRSAAFQNLFWGEVSSPLPLSALGPLPAGPPKL